MLQIVGPINVKNMFDEVITLDCEAFEYVPHGPYARLPGEKWFPHHVQGVVWELYFRPGDNLTWAGQGGVWIPIGYDNTKKGRDALQEILSRAGDPPEWMWRKVHFDLNKDGSTTIH